MTAQPYYDSSVQKSPAIEEIREIRRYKYLIFQLTRRDILARYKRSFLGVAWTMLNPLGMMIVMTIVFSNLFKSVESYPAYVLSGLIAWNFFSQSTNAAMSGIMWGGNLMQRIYVPRTSFALSAILTALVNLVLSIVPLIIVMLFTRTPISISILFLPISMVILAAFALGVGLILSTMAVYFPDVSEMYQIILIAWMYLSPVIYPESIIPERILTIYHLNPMYHLIRLFRLPIYGGRIPTIEEILPAAIISIIVLVVGWLFFTSKSDEFAYRI
ncbi:MAG: ABC transporter permease [Porphyromonadaceae bacterium]|nr:ABC transporter permease [Porphyromonadaceae bacterium]